MNAGGGRRMKPRLKKIPVGASGASSMIDYKKRYRVRIDGRWYEGTFSRRWFGWNLEGYGTSGIQLDLVDEVFEIMSCPRRQR
jgi:hypothetical protein